LGLQLFQRKQSGCHREILVLLLVLFVESDLGGGLS